MVNKDKLMMKNKPGDVRYLISPQTSLFSTISRTSSSMQNIDTFQYILREMEDKILNVISTLQT